MKNSIYINPTEAYCGKSLITLGLMEHLLRNTQKVGIFRPVIKNTAALEMDHDIGLILSHFNLNIDYEDTYAYSEDKLHELENQGKHDDIIDFIIRKFKALEERFDFIVIEGSDYESKNSIYEFNLNVEIAKNLGSPVIIIGKADEETSIENQAYLIHQTVDNFIQKGCQVLKVIVNRVPDRINEALAQELKSKLPKDLLDFDFIPEDHVLSSPTIAEIAEALSAKVLYGENQLNRLAYYYTIAAMQPHNYLARIKENSLIITPGDRGDDLFAGASVSQLSFFSWNHPFSRL
jgi:phosphate acetyltransferase